MQDETRRENEATREADREKSIAPWAKVAARGITAAPSAMQIGDDVQKLIARRSPREETKVADPPRVTTPAQTEGIVSRSLRPEVAPNDTAAHPAKKRIVVTEANRKQVAGQIFRSRLINTLKEVQLPIYDAILYDPNSPIYSRKKNKVPDIVITLPFNVDFYAFEPVTPTVTVSDVVTLAPEYEDAIARRHQPYERYKPYLFAACSVVAVLIAIGLGREAPSIPEPNPQTAKTAPSSDRTGAGSRKRVDPVKTLQRGPGASEVTSGNSGRVGSVPPQRSGAPEPKPAPVQPTAPIAGTVPPALTKTVPISPVEPLKSPPSPTDVKAPTVASPPVITRPQPQPAPKPVRDVSKQKLAPEKKPTPAQRSPATVAPPSAGATISLPTPAGEPAKLTPAKPRPRQKPKPVQVPAVDRDSGAAPAATPSNPASSGSPVKPKQRPPQKPKPVETPEAEPAAPSPHVTQPTPTEAGGGFGGILSPLTNTLKKLTR